MYTFKKSLKVLQLSPLTNDKRIKEAHGVTTIDILKVADIDPAWPTALRNKKHISVGVNSQQP